MRCENPWPAGEQQAVEMLHGQPLEVNDVGARRGAPVAQHVGHVLSQLGETPRTRAPDTRRPPVEGFVRLVAFRRDDGSVGEAARVQLDLGPRPRQGPAERVVVGGREGRRIDDLNAHGNGQ